MCVVFLFIPVHHAPLIHFTTSFCFFLFLSVYHLSSCLSLLMHAACWLLCQSHQHDTQNHCWYFRRRPGRGNIIAVVESSAVAVFWSLSSAGYHSNKRQVSTWIKRPKVVSCPLSLPVLPCPQTFYMITGCRSVVCRGRICTGLISYRDPKKLPDTCLYLPAGGQQTSQLPVAAQSHDLHHPEPWGAGTASVAQETRRAAHAYLRSIGWHPALRLPPAEPQEHPKPGKWEPWEKNVCPYRFHLLWNWWGLWVRKWKKKTFTL